MHYDSNADIYEVFHSTDAELGAGLNSMIHSKSDIHFHVWNGTAGKTVHRIGKHGQRTGEAVIGTSIKVKRGRAVKEFIVESIDGNIVQCSGNKEFSFPRDLDDESIVSISLPDNGDMVHLENAICVGEAATVSFKSGTLTSFRRDPATKMFTTTGQLSRDNERDFNVGNDSQSGAKFFASLSQCTPIVDGYGQVVQQDTRHHKSKMQEPFVPMYSNGTQFYSLFSLSAYERQIQGWQAQSAPSEVITASVSHKSSGNTWPLHAEFIDPLYSGKLEHSARVNVPRDLFGSNFSTTNRCFDSVVRNFYGGADGMSYPVKDKNATATMLCSNAIRDDGALCSDAASMCRIAAAKLTAMLRTKTIQYDQARIMNLSAGHSYPQREEPKHVFWHAFDNLNTTRQYCKIYQFVKARAGQTGSVVFTKDLHDMMKVVQC